LLRAILERDAHKVWDAATTAETLEVMEKSAAPDLAILDLRLNEESGVEILRRIRADQVYRQLPVLFCSGVPDREAVMEAAQLGVVGFLAKPLDPARVRAGVAKALGSRWTRVHFDDVLAVCHRLSTDRDRIGDIATRFFRELAAMLLLVIESDEERASALRQIAGLRRVAADLGLRLLEPALEQWEKANVSDKEVPPILRRAPVIGRLYASYIV
jgi:CheY-like chemotaxis protein